MGIDDERPRIPDDRLGRFKAPSPEIVSERGQIWLKEYLENGIGGAFSQLLVELYAEHQNSPLANIIQLLRTIERMYLSGVLEESELAHKLFTDFVDSNFCRIYTNTERYVILLKQIAELAEPYMECFRRLDRLRRGRRP